MGAHDSRVDEQVFQVGVATRGLGDSLPDTLFAPTGEAHKCPVPMAKFDRQVAPRTPCAHDPEDGLDKAPIVLGRTTWIARLAWQQRFNAFPLVIAQHLSVHPDSVQKSEYDHISITVNSPLLCH
jgi:hypothetical protein